MTTEIFEADIAKALFEDEVFQPPSVEQAPAPPKGWQVWMTSTVVHATVALATAGTLIATQPDRACPASSPHTPQVRFVYTISSPLLTPAQRARASRLAQTLVPRPHPDDEPEEIDFV